MYKWLQQQVQPKMLLLLLISLSLLIIMACYLYVLKMPLQALHESEKTLELLNNEEHFGIPLLDQISEQERLNQALNLKLHGMGPKLPMNQMVIFVIGELDKISDRHQVNLASVTPGEPGKMFTFSVMDFKIEITGAYIRLFNWLKDVETELGPIIINQFDIQPATQDNAVKMELTITNYQFEDLK